MTRLEDYLRSETDPILPTNLIERKEEFVQEIDAIVDDGGISGQSFSIDEIMELESRNHPNLGYEFLEDDEHYVDHEEEYHFNPNWFDESRLLFETDNSTSSVEYDFSFKSEPDTFPEYLLNDPEIVGYPDEETQEEIYEWVNSKLPKHHFSIKDLGCGRGDFFRVLMRHNGYSDDRIGIDYFGIDNNPNLIRVGQQKYPELKLIYSDFNDVSIQTDYTICIGTLNDDHNLDKWEFFNKTLNHTLNNTKTAIIFVLQADCYGEPGHLDYPIHELIEKLPSGTRFEIDNSKFEDIYCLTVHIGQF